MCYLCVVSEKFRARSLPRQRRGALTKQRKSEWDLPTADFSQKLYRVPVIASDTSHSLAEMSGLYSLAGSLERTG